MARQIKIPEDLLDLVLRAQTLHVYSSHIYSSIQSERFVFSGLPFDFKGGAGYLMRQRMYLIIQLFNCCLNCFFQDVNPIINKDLLGP